MSVLLEGLTAKFLLVKSNQDLFELIKEYQFLPNSKTKLAPQELGDHVVSFGDVEVRVVHRWVDPSGPFQNETDVNKVRLLVDGRQKHQIEFSD